MSSRHFHQKTYTHISGISQRPHSLPTSTSLPCSSSLDLEGSTNHAAPHNEISPASRFPFPQIFCSVPTRLRSFISEFKVIRVLLNDCTAFGREKCSFYGNPRKILWNLLMVLFSQLSQTKLKGEKKSIQSDGCYSHCSLPTSSLFV